MDTATQVPLKLMGRRIGCYARRRRPATYLVRSSSKPAISHSIEMIRIVFATLPTWTSGHISCVPATRCSNTSVTKGSIRIEGLCARAGVAVGITVRTFPGLVLVWHFGFTRSEIILSYVEFHSTVCWQCWPMLNSVTKSLPNQPHTRVFLLPVLQF